MCRGLLEPWVEDCPLNYQSNNASGKREVLATFLLSILAGHQRYAHITALRQDGIHPELLGAKRRVSEDAARRALKHMDEAAGIAWLDTHLAKCTQPLLSTPWILDLDGTVKCLYGKQEGALVGYNAKKPGRPSHCYHSALMANTRLALRVDVMAGKETAPSHSMPGIWAWLDTLPQNERPSLLRGDVAYGNEAVLREAEIRHQPSLSKLKLSAKVKTLIKSLFRQSGVTVNYSPLLSTPERYAKVSAADWLRSVVSTNAASVLLHEWRDGGQPAARHRPDSRRDRSRAGGR